MKIIITGASGFVGNNLSVFLRSKGYETIPFSLRIGCWENKLEKDAEAIIHLAGKAHDTANTSHNSEYFKINTELTKEVFQKFLKSNIRDFFYFSSVKATADSVEEILDENHQSDPKTPYGKSKLQAEEFLRSQPLQQGKRLFIIRPCMIHGPGNKGNLNLLYKLVEKGIPWPLAAFHNERSFLSIDNLNYLILKILQNPAVPSGIYNFADDGSLSTNDLVKIISKASGKSAKLWKIPAGLIGSVAKIGDAVKLPLNSERLRKLTESYVVSNQKIKTALKIENLPLSAEEGLIKTVKSFKSKR